MSKIDRRTFLRNLGLGAAGIVILGEVGLTACGSSDQKPGQPGDNKSQSGGAKKKLDVIKIGTIQPLSGALAFAGTQCLVGIKIAADKINAAGGIKSLGGAKIELVSADSQGKPEVGSAEVERLITRERVAALVGAYQSATTVATTQVAEKNRIVHMIDEGISADVLSRGFKYSFRVIADATMASKKTVKYAVELARVTGKEFKTVVVMHENTAFGTSMAKVIQAEAPKAGLQVLEVIGYPPTTPDLTTEVSKALQKKPDVILWSGYFGDGVLGARAFTQLKGQSIVKAVIGNTNGAFSTDKFITDAGPASDGFFDNNHRWNTKSPDLAYIKSELEKRKAPLTHDIIDAYAAATVLFDAIKRAGTDDRDAIREAVASTNLKLDVLQQKGPVKFDQTGQNVNAETLLTQVQGDRILVVHPPEFAEAKPVMKWA